MIEPAEWTTLSQRVDAELDALAASGIARWLVLVAVVFALTWAMVWAIGAAARFWNAFFPDPRRRSDRVAALVRVAVTTAGVLVALRPIVIAAPLVSGTVLLAMLLVLSRVLATPLRNLLAGLALSRRVTFTEGDRITVGNATGIVSHIGLWRTLLTAPDGSRIALPNHEIADRGITIGGTMGAERVRVELELSAPPSPDDIERLRRALVASPFRRHRGAAVVTGDGTRRIVAELETWASRRTDEVGRRIAAVLRRATEPEPEPVDAQEGGT